MMHGSIERPPRLYGTPDQKCQQMYSYLYSLADQLQNIFDSMSTDNTVSNDIIKRIDTLEKATGISRKTISG